MSTANPQHVAQQVHKKIEGLQQIHNIFACAAFLCSRLIFLGVFSIFSSCFH